MSFLFSSFRCYPQIPGQDWENGERCVCSAAAGGGGKRDAAVGSPGEAGPCPGCPVSQPQGSLWSELWKTDRLSEPSVFAGSGCRQLPCRGVSGAVFMAHVLLLSPQINTAKRLLEKGKEAADREPERSWFQTKEERKKEKSKSERFLRKLILELLQAPAICSWVYTHKNWEQELLQSLVCQCFLKH